MYQVRAGRRAGTTTAASAVDPLADPTPPPPAPAAPAAAAPTVSTAETTTLPLSTAPAANRGGAVSWLDDPEPTTTAPLTSPAAIAPQTSRAPLAAPNVSVVDPSPVVQNTTIISSRNQTRRRPAEDESGPSWLGEEGDPFSPPAPLTDAAPSPQYSVMGTAPSALQSPTSYVAPALSQQPPQPQQLRSAVVSPFSPIVAAPVTSPVVVAPPPAPTITYTYSDDTTLVAQLTAELASTEKDMQELTTSVETLTSRTHREWEAIQESSSSLASLKEQLALATEAKRQNEEQHALKLKLARERHEAAVGEMRRMAGAVVIDEQEAAVASLRSQVSQAEAAVVKQRDVLQTTLKEMENATLNTTANSTAAAQLAAQVGVLIRDERGKVRRLARSVLHDQTRGAVDVVRLERHDALEAARSSRRAMLEDHIRSRKEAFQLSRTKSQRDRQESTDKLFASIKLKLIAATEEKRNRAKNMVKEQVERMQRDAANARAETTSALERIIAGQDADRTASAKGHAAREEDLRLRLMSLEQHTLSVQKAEEESLKRLGEKFFAEDAKREDPLRLVFAAAETSGALCSPDSEMQTKLSALIEHIRSSMAAVRHHGDQQSEVLKLTRQREEVVKELQEHISTSKESLQRSWHHLESLLTRLSTAAESFEKSVRQSRTDVSVAQQQVDATRAAWESDVRQRLANVFLESSAGSMLPQSPFHVVEDTMYQIGCSLREMQSKMCENKRCRSMFVREQSVAADLLREKQVNASKLVSKVLDTFQELAQANATLTTKTAWVEAEELDARSAREHLDSDKLAFQQAVALAREVADRLREQAENLPPPPSQRQQQFHDASGWVRHEAPHSHQQGPLDMRERRSSSGVPRRTDSSGHLTNKDKYRHLYDDANQSSHSTTTGSSQAAPNHRTFQSLVLLDTTMGNDLSRYQLDGSVQSSGSPPKDELMKLPEAIPVRGSSSGSSSDPRAADARRHSLTTPSVSESGRL